MMVRLSLFALRREALLIGPDGAAEGTFGV
jgi:hypothetical protein